MLPQAMFSSLPESAQSDDLWQSPVTAISMDTQTNHMKSLINGNPGPKIYPAVISTAPPPGVSLMDLTGVNIKYNGHLQQTELSQAIIGEQRPF